MLHNNKHKLLDISRYRYLRLVIPLCSIFAFLMGNFILNIFFGSNNCYAAVNPTASLSVSNPTLSTTVAPGDTAYLSSNVTYSASDIDSYTLQVSYANGYSSLKLDGGTTTLTGANGATGSSLANNSWGFAWTNNTTNNTSTNAGLTYYTVPTYGTSGSGLSTGRLENATLPESANNTLSSTTKRIVFAAKFAENNNNSGHYKTGVQLSMVATPRKLIGLEKANTMQDLATHPEYCEETPYLSGQTYSDAYLLKDSRDGSVYNIRKLGDGRCWMTSNLKLKLTTAGLSKDDTDLNQGVDWNQSSPSTVVKPTNTLTSLNTSSGNRDFSADKGYYAVQSYIASSSNAGETGYYSWNAATAGTGGTANTTGNFVPAGSQAPSSICPKGWTLPTGGGQSDVNTESTWSDYYKLFRNMGLTISNTNLKPGANEYTNWGSGDLNIVQNATDSNSKVIYNFKYPGYVINGSLGHGTSHGYWWSSTASSATNAYSLRIGSSGVNPGTSLDNRYDGFAVRCVMRDPDLSEITTMQEMTPRVCEKTPLISGQKYSAEYTLKDTRDGNTYTVRKFADGRCWMTENLRINNTTLKAASSDFSGSDIVLPNSAKSDFTDANKFTYRSGLFSEANSGSTGYYNWYTATAGAGNSSFTTNNQSVNTSICPKGWTLPTGGSTSNVNTTSTWTNFYGLFRNMGLTISNTNLKPGYAEYTNWGSGDLNTVQNATDSNSKVIYNFKYTGYVYNGSLNYGTDRGYWWSSTAYSARSAYGLSIYSSYVYPGTVAFYRYFGIAVRCIARDS